MLRSGLLRDMTNQTTFLTVVMWSIGSLLPAQNVDLVETFDVETYDVDELMTAADAGRPFVLRYFGNDHRVSVKRNELRSDRFSYTAVNRDGFRSLLPARTRTYKGRVDGEPRSVVRLTIDDRGLSGYIKSSEGWTFIEPLDRDRKVARASADRMLSHRVFGEKDIAPCEIGRCIEQHADADCHLNAQLEEASAHESEARIESGTARTEARQIALPTSEHGEDTAPLVAGATAPTMEVAIVADHEFFQLHGANALTEIESIVNAAEGIFEREMGLGIEIVDVTIWQDEGDPYEATDALELLVELRGYWNANKDAVPRDVVHLFTGKDLDSSTVGIAYVGVVCQQTNAFSLSQDIQSHYLEGILVAHEFGHTLGAQHDTADTSPRYVMSPSLGGTSVDEFSEQSQTQIDNYIAGISCLASAENNDQGDSSEGEGAGEGRPRSGGGGGPIDPILLTIVAAGVGIEHLRRRRRSRC